MSINDLFFLFGFTAVLFNIDAVCFGLRRGPLTPES